MYVYIYICIYIYICMFTYTYRYVTIQIYIHIVYRRHKAHTYICVQIHAYTDRLTGKQTDPHTHKDTHNTIDTLCRYTLDTP